jgi:hypothetical protein
MTTGDEMDDLNARMTVRLAPMSPAVRNALIEVLNYVSWEEEKDWEKNGEPEQGHIWLSIRKVWHWLESR